MIIRFSEFSRNLSTRRQATAFRESILVKLRQGNSIVFDFKDVFVISNSFADECFGKLLLEVNFEVLKSKTTFKNTNDMVKSTISFALKQRLGQLG